MLRARALLMAFAVALAARDVAAQSANPWLVSGRVGISLRGEGDINACCGPYTSDADGFRSVWFGGGVSKRIAPGLSLDGEFTWGREPEYEAAFTGVLPGQPARSYWADENRITTWTAAGLLRLHAFQNGIATLDVVGGLGLDREHRSGQATSTSFRGPHPGDPPPHTVVTDTSRNLLLGIVGADLSATQGVMVYSIQGRLHLLAGPRDEVRTDLEPGRVALRIGLSVGRRF